MNFRKATIQIVLAVKRRLEKSNPGAVLDESSVRLVAIPKTHFDATIFCFTVPADPKTASLARTRLVAEIGADRIDLPHIYAGRTVDPNAKGSITSLVWVVAQLGYRILTDPRFSRSNIIRVNGFPRALARS